MLGLEREVEFAHREEEERGLDSGSGFRVQGLGEEERGLGYGSGFRVTGVPRS